MFISQSLRSKLNGILRRGLVLANDHHSSRSSRRNPQSFSNETFQATGKYKFFIDKYNQHIRTLTNSIHDNSPSLPSKGHTPYYFAVLEKSSHKTNILQHFFILSETKNNKMLEQYNKLVELSVQIREKRHHQNKSNGLNRQRLGKEVNELDRNFNQLKDEFGELFQRFYDKSNSAVMEDFGVCDDCISLFIDKKKQKIYRNKLNNFHID